jgi:probable HAF family extracellular repeat protein
VPQWLSRRGRVVGKMTLVGDLTNHPFLWDQGVLRDLGTFGGDNGNALWVNDDGVVVGQADVVGSQEHHAFLWTQGVMNDLGTLDGDSCSVAWAINSKGQVVGTSDQCIAAPRAFLWERGQIIDLNVFVPPSSDLTLVEPHYINERGEITGNAVLSNGDLRAFLLIPCDEGHPDIKSCDYSLANTTTAASRPSPMVGDVSSRTRQLGMRPGYRPHFPGAAVRPIN